MIRNKTIASQSGTTMVLLEGENIIFWSTETRREASEMIAMEFIVLRV